MGRSTLSDQTLHICEVGRNVLASGGDLGVAVAALADKYGVQRPAIYKSLRTGGVLPPYKERKDGGKGRPVGGGVRGYTERRRRTHSEIKSAFEAKAEQLRVNRDPCTYCGVRVDVGCRHVLREAL